jgi:hypothetical protein
MGYPVVVPTEPAGGAASRDFAEWARTYLHALSRVLTENRGVFWKRSFWTRGHWARRDSELQKILARFGGLLDELLRLHDAGRVSESVEGRVRQVLDLSPDRITLDSAIERFDILDRILVEVADERVICSEIERELLWAKGSTTWLTWDRMFEKADERTPKAVEAYRKGEKPSSEDLDAARNRLYAFRSARSNDYQVHRARQKMRARNLRLLAVCLFPLVGGFGWLLATRSGVGISGWEAALVAVLGALGAVMSGTIRARDKLLRGSDLRAFRSGLLAQVLLGAGSALLLLLLLAGKIITIAGADTLAGHAAFGFVAGFSEPFFLKIVERVAKMGEESPKKDTSQNA